MKKITKDYLGITGIILSGSLVVASPFIKYESDNYVKNSNQRIEQVKSPKANECSLEDTISLAPLITGLFGSFASALYLAKRDDYPLV